MDLYLMDLMEKNKEKVQNKFDYLFIYIHWFIFHHFPQDQVITEILEYARDGFKKYRMEYKINSSTIGIIPRKKEHQFEITATNNEIGSLEHVDFMMHNSLQKQANTERYIGQFLNCITYVLENYNKNKFNNMSSTNGSSTVVSSSPSLMITNDK